MTARHLILSMAALAALPFAADAGEVLAVDIPDGHHLGYSAGDARFTIREWVPRGETVNDWTRMVTLVEHLGGLAIGLAEYEEAMRKGFHNEACQGPGYEPLESGRINGYSYRSFRLSCDLLTSTGRPEWTLFKVIEGLENVYAVQKAFRYRPDSGEIAEWRRILHDRALVCDTRLAGRPCPDWAE